MNPFAEYDGLTLDPDRHRPIEPPGDYVSALRRDLNCPDLMLYHHLEHDRFVLGIWWQKRSDGGGVICEFLSFGVHPDQLRMSEDVGVPDPVGGVLNELPSKETIGLLYLKHSEDRYNDLMREFSRAESDTTETNQERQQEIKDLGDHIAKHDIHRGDHPFVKDMQIGELPPVMPDV